MGTWMRTAVLLAALACGTAGAWAAEFRLAANNGHLVLELPQDWQATDSKETRFAPTVELKGRQGPDFRVLVSTVGSQPSGAHGPAAAEWSESMTKRGAANALAQAVESSLPLQPLRSDRVQGYFFHATDRAPKPGEYKFLVQGAAVVQDVRITFTILVNDDSRTAIEAGLGMLRQARVAVGVAS